MKYRTVWKPGGHPRRGGGSMKVERQKMQARKPKGTIPGKEAAHLGNTGKAAA